MMKIEIDGHFHGVGKVPRPWAARIVGPDPKYGLAREFVQSLNDWESARRAWSGNVYGVVAHFPLRRGAIYEVSRLRGSSSKRHVSREFYDLPLTGRRVRIDPEEALDRIGGGPGVSLRLAAAPSTQVDEVRGLGRASRLGWVVIDHRRLYRLRDDHVYAIDEGGSHRLVVVRGGDVESIGQRAALEHMEASGWL